MLADKLEKLKNSSKTITAEELINTYQSIHSQLHASWQTTLSGDHEGREEIYRQIKGLDAVFIKLVSRES